MAKQLVCWTPIKPGAEAMRHQACGVHRELRLHLIFQCYSLAPSWAEDMTSGVNCLLSVPACDAGQHGNGLLHSCLQPPGTF